ncbi:hypothetical protein ACH5RR_021229 [Cinchona calisaya]|uniref:Reverse transcriptase/retrotransposon-derived protein RNase H-like domain-containing protein n=1 Tax=Cinchona calisaya TaxID=153742 RepID=A0ABD2ZK76_9GENT
MSNTHALTLPNFSKPFVVKTNTSYSGIGALPIQDKRPIAYLGKSLNQRNLGLSIYEKELLALMTTVQKLRHYLEGALFHHKDISLEFKTFVGAENKKPNAIKMAYQTAWNKL